MLSFFWVVVRLFPEPEARRQLLVGGAVLAALAGVLSLPIALGWHLGDQLQTHGDQLVRKQHGLGEVERVRLPGLSLGYALFWYVGVRAVTSRGLHRALWAALLAGIVLGIAVSFNRNMWVGLAVGLLLLLVVGGVAVRARLTLALAVGAVGTLLIGLVGVGLGHSKVLGPLVERGQTVLRPSEVARESSLRDRERETERAWGKAVGHLTLGVGPGAAFGVFTFEKLGPNSFVLVPQLFLHNQYLYLLLIGGIPALLTFLMFLVRSLRTAWSRVPHDGSIAACGVGIAMIMMSALVAIYFSVEDMTTPLGLLAGVIAADRAGRPPVHLDSDRTN
jgi:O-antigen ligase